VHAYPAFGDRPLSRIRLSDVQGWVTGLEKSKGMAPSTVRTTFNSVRAVFRAAVKDRVIASSPCDGVDLPDVPRRKVVPLTVEQVRTLAAALPERYQALAITAAGTGLRPGELFGLQVRHVNFLRRTVRVEQQVQQTPKGGTRVCPPKTKESARVVPLPATVIDTLAAHLKAFPAGPDDFVFQDPKGGAIVASLFLTGAWHPARAKAGLPDVGLHALRHTYASLLIAAGESVKVVSDRLGHTNAAMTLNVYSHLFPDSEDRTRKAIDGAFTVSVQDHADSVRTDETR
jgi:integrase